MPLICFASPKGGVGKTTMAANVAADLAARGRRVIAVDLDPQDALGLHFGLALGDHAGFLAMLSENSPPDFWRSCLLETHAGVLLLPHGRLPIETEVAKATALGMRPALLDTPMRNLLATPDTVVIADMPPGPSAALATLLPLTDLLVTVLLTDASSLAQIPAIDNGQVYGRITTEWFERDRMGFVLNQWDNRTRLGRASGEAAALHFGARLLGVVYRDENVSEAIAAQRLVFQYAPGSKAAQDLAALSEVIEQRLLAAGAPVRGEERGVRT
jgi:cellulose synthase operon protein YhjQ